MVKTMLALAKMQFKDYNIYKSNFYLFTLNRIVEVVVYIFVWQAIYNQTGNAGGFELSQMVTYYILAISFSSLATWGINEMMAHSIRNGQINKELLNPISYFKYYFGINLGELAFAIVIGTATFIICSIFWQLNLPANLFPYWFQKLSVILPFKELVYTPINIWLGQASCNEVIFVIIKQIIWGFILYIVAKSFFNHAVKNITINGG